MLRSLAALTCTLSLAAMAQKPLDVRLPVAELGGAKYQRTQLVAALYAVSGMRLAPPGQPPPEPMRPIVLVWEDGRVLWSEDALAGGPPYRSGFVTKERAAAVTERFKNRAPALLTQESLGPDAPFATLMLRLPGGRYGVMKSWHPRDPNAKALATSHGLVAREGRDPAAVLATDTKEYQAFRRLWTEVEDELVAVAHQAARSAPITAKLEWDWLKALPPAPRLQLSLIGSPGAWQFAVDEARLATVADLRAFLEKQPKGTVLTWDPGCKRAGDEPLLSSEKDLAAFTAFCRDHGIELVILPGG